MKLASKAEALSNRKIQVRKKAKDAYHCQEGSVYVGVQCSRVCAHGIGNTFEVLQHAHLAEHYDGEPQVGAKRPGVKESLPSSVLLKMRLYFRLAFLWSLPSCRQKAPQVRHFRKPSATSCSAEPQTRFPRYEGQRKVSRERQSRVHTT